MTSCDKSGYLFDAITQQQKQIDVDLAGDKLDRQS